MYFVSKNIFQVITILAKGIAKLYSNKSLISFLTRVSPKMKQNIQMGTFFCVCAGLATGGCDTYSQVWLFWFFFCVLKGLAVCACARAGLEPLCEQHCIKGFIIIMTIVIITNTTTYSTYITFPQKLKTHFV